MNILTLLEMAAAGFGDRVALGSLDDGLTYQQLLDRAGTVAARFAGAGVERVLLVDENGPAVPLALFGAAWAGLAYAPVNYRLSDGELRALAEQAAPAVVVCEPQEQPALATVDGLVVWSRSELLEGTATGAPPGDWPMDPEAIAVLLATSGTTGAPKAAVLRHRHLTSYVIGSVEFGAAGDDEATLVSVPPYHVAGVAAMLSSVYAARRIVQLPRFTPEGWLDLAARERVTHAFVVPTMLARIVDALEAGAGAVPSTLRTISYGGGKMPLPVIERALRLFPDAGFVNAYGLTETSSTIAVLGPDDHRHALEAADPAVRARLTSAGRPLPGVEVEVRDEAGAVCGVGQRGEVHVRGEQVSGEYLGAGSRLDPDGWFPTRDAGWLDADGYLFVEGRIDDVIIRGGENISPGEIEDALLGHPDVADVAVVGVPDVEWGERVAAAVVLQPGAALDEVTLRAWSRERLRTARTPDVVVFVPALPYTETGKLLRRTVREQLAGAVARP